MFTKDELKKLSMSANIDLKDQFKSLLKGREIAYDAPLLNFQVPEDITVVV